MGPTLIIVGIVIASALGLYAFVLRSIRKNGELPEVTRNWSVPEGRKN